MRVSGISKINTNPARLLPEVRNPNPIYDAIETKLVFKTKDGIKEFFYNKDISYANHKNDKHTISIP